MTERLTEAQLFAAFGQPDGSYQAECACGDRIVALTARGVANEIAAHYESDVHQQWRKWQAAIEALKRPTRHRCPCKEDVA